MKPITLGALRARANIAQFSEILFFRNAVIAAAEL